MPSGVILTQEASGITNLLLVLYLLRVVYNFYLKLKKGYDIAGRFLPKLHA